MKHTSKRTSTNRSNGNKALNNKKKINEVYSEITNLVISELEKGTLPWSKPWTGSSPALNLPLRHNGENYKGMNVLILWCAAHKKNFVSDYWMTFKQVIELGGNVKKGEKSAKIFYANKILIEEENNDGEKESKAIPYMKTYAVFNVDQIENLPDEYYKKAEPPIVNDSISRNETIDKWLQNTGAKIKHEGSRAFYSPANDEITLPEFEHFKRASGYYATSFHELTHWTGAKHRLNREKATTRTKESYAFEELIAELGASFLSADHGIESRIREDHAPYIASWISALNNDHSLIFKAASKAQAAMDFLHGIKGS